MVMEMSAPEGINVNILFMILGYSCTRYYRWIQSKWNLFLLFLTTACESTISSYKKFNLIKAYFALLDKLLT